MYPYFCLTAAMVLVGSSVVAGKIFTDTVPVFFGSALRFVLALAVLMPLMKLREGGFLPRLSRRSWALLLLQSLFGSFLFTVFLLYGLRYTGPGPAGVITSATPACMGIFSWLFLREKIGPVKLLGIACAVSGVMVLNVLAGNTAGGASEGQNSLWGNALVLGAVVAESLFLLIRKGVREPLSPVGASTAVSLGGLAWFLPFAVYELIFCDLAAIPMTGWLAVAYYGLIVTVAAYLFWFAGIVHVDGAVAGVFTAVMPVSAVLLAWAVLGIRPEAGVIFGGLGVLAGILLMTRNGART